MHLDLQESWLLVAMFGMIIFTVSNRMYMCSFPVAMITFDIAILVWRAPGQSRLYRAFLRREKYLLGMTVSARN